MRKYKFFILLFIFFFVVNVNINAEECLDSYDSGSHIDVVVPANPNLTIDNGYSTSATSQRSAWYGGEGDIYTNVTSSGFDFEITGAWSPWYGTDYTGNTNDGPVTLKADPSTYCLFEIENSNSEEMSTSKGEFEYIRSYSRYVKNGTLYTEYTLEPRQQKSCYLRGGDGLYIAFFGRTGNELPSMATHLKTMKVICPSQYATDKNDDGIVTFDECYDSESVPDKNGKYENKAYYAPYDSGIIHGYVDCEEEYFHGSDPDRIGINDCYLQEELKDGTLNKVDKTRFHFRADKLYKDIYKNSVKSGEVMKFMIYDRYYSDNVGQYTIKIYKGYSDQQDAGLVQKILNDLEKVFVGEKDEYGNRTSGILYTFYHYIIRDSNFALIIRFSLILYMTFFGFHFMNGTIKQDKNEFYKLLLKLTFVISFTTERSWDLYNRFIVNFFIDGINSVVILLGNICRTIFVSNVEVTNSLTDKFAFIDELITFAFSDTNTKKIQGLFFAVKEHGIGFLTIPIYYGLVIYFVIKLVNAVFPYIISFIQAVFALSVGPIFICFYLFDTTKYMFDNWLMFLVNKFMNMAFIFMFIFIFGGLIREQFEELLLFRVCKRPIWSAVVGNSSTFNKVANFFSLGIKVWDYTPTNEYKIKPLLEFIMSLLFIFVYINLFAYLMEKQKSIIDGLIGLNGVKGSGSAKGDMKGSESLGSALDNAFKTDKWTYDEKSKSWKKEEVGIATRASDYIKDTFKDGLGLMSKGISKAGKSISNAIMRKAEQLVEGQVGDSAIDSTKESGKKGYEAVEEAVKNFRNSLEEDKKIRDKDEKDYTAHDNRSKKIIDSAVDAFRKKAEEEFINEPIAKQLANFEKQAKEKGLGGTELMKDVKDNMNNWIKDNFGDALKKDGKEFDLDNFDAFKTIKFQYAKKDEMDSENKKYQEKIEKEKEENKKKEEEDKNKEKEENKKKEEEDKKKEEEDKKKKEEDKKKEEEDKKKKEEDKKKEEEDKKKEEEDKKKKEEEDKKKKEEEDKNKNNSSSSSSSSDSQNPSNKDGVKEEVKNENLSFGKEVDVGLKANEVGLKANEVGLKANEIGLGENKEVENFSNDSLSEQLKEMKEEKESMKLKQEQNKLSQEAFKAKKEGVELSDEKQEELKNIEKKIAKNKMKNNK